MERYVSIKDIKNIEEGFSKEKPKPEAGYTLKRVKKRIGGKVVNGWLKTKKKNAPNKKAKTGLSKAQLKKRAKKASRTKRSHPSIARKALRKSRKTRKLNK